MKIHSTERGHDKLPDFLFVRKFSQSLLNPLCLLDCCGGMTDSRLGTHRLSGDNEKQEGWQDDTASSPANGAREHKGPSPCLRLLPKRVLWHYGKRRRNAREYTTRFRGRQKTSRARR